jgi:O-glycosyl hydrolase
MTIIERALHVAAATVLSLVTTISAGGADPARQRSAGEVAITVDGSRTFQRIDGFGVNANARSWNNGQLAPALDLLVDQMGARIFRVILEKSDWQSGPDGADLASFNWDYYTPIYESPKFQNLWGIIGYLNAKQTPVVMLNLMGTIPDWMGGTSLSPDQEDQWVKMVASLVYYGRNVRHVQFNLLSPMNEEDLGAPEGPRVSPEQYARLMGKLAARLAALGLDDVKLVGPDTASAGAGATEYAPVMLADPALMAQVEHFSVHSYSSDTGPMPATLRQSAYGDRDFWVTEWSAWCQGCDNGRPVQAEWSFASDTTDLLLDHLEHGASAALVYEGYDSYYEHHGAFSYWGQLAFDSATGSYSPRPRFFTNAQVFRFVLPGMVRIASSSSDEGVRALAFRDPSSGQLAIVGHNSHSTDATLRISLQGSQVPGPGSVFHLVQTTVGAGLVPGGDAAVQDGDLSTTIAGDAFFTLTTSGEVTPTVAAQPRMSVAPTPVSATAALLGEPDLQNSVDTDAAGTAEAFQYTAGASGPANRLYVYVGAGSAAGQLQVGLYADNGDQPGNLLASATIVGPTGGAWNHVEIPEVQIQAGARYWIAVLGPAGGGPLELLDGGTAGGTSVTSADLNLAALPSTWSSGATWSSSPLSAYAAHEP